MLADGHRRPQRDDLLVERGHLQLLSAPVWGQAQSLVGLDQVGVGADDGAVGAVDLLPPVGRPRRPARPARGCRRRGAQSVSPGRTTTVRGGGASGAGPVDGGGLPGQQVADVHGHRGPVGERESRRRRARPGRSSTGSGVRRSGQAARERGAAGGQHQPAERGSGTPRRARSRPRAASRATRPVTTHSQLPATEQRGLAEPDQDLVERRPLGTGRRQRRAGLDEVGQQPAAEGTEGGRTANQTRRQRASGAGRSSRDMANAFVCLRLHQSTPF